MKKNSLTVIRYFLQFGYPPTFKELHTFYPGKISRFQLARELTTLERENKVISSDTDRNNSVKIYTLEGYTILFQEIKAKIVCSEDKKTKAAGYLKRLSYIPEIILIGISGTVAMNNAKEKDDIDLFIISRAGRLWTARIKSLFLAELMGVRRKRDQVVAVKDKVCLNLFFDGSDLQVPPHKQNEYVAHEILQMKPVISKERAYERLLQANKWVLKYFPNSIPALLPRSVSGEKGSGLFTRARKDKGAVGYRLEKLAKKIQLFFISRHRTREYVSATQLWFHPEDFAKKVKT
ncbi:hypothetical protein HY214_02995 [Candidatus Roizmanbacteria bacterium]|nr:hypothetical protein [Candidatus Roizmanbacteria bacterium]